MWREYVKTLPGWQERRYENYLPVTLDVTAFWRPALKNCPSKHYHPAANRALPAVIFGIAGEVCEINGQRIALPRAFERVHPKDPSETRLWDEILKNAKKRLKADEIAVIDAGLKISDLQAAEIVHYVICLVHEFNQRDVNRRKRRVVEARFPVLRTLDEFDFNALPSLNRNQVLDLVRGEYILRKENIALIGVIGTGKTHIAISLGLAACEQGSRVRFFTAAGLINELLEAEKKHTA